MSLLEHNQIKLLRSGSTVETPIYFDILVLIHKVVDDLDILIEILHHLDHANNGAIFMKI